MGQSWVKTDTVQNRSVEDKLLFLENAKESKLSPSILQFCNNIIKFKDNVEKIPSLAEELTTLVKGNNTEEKQITLKNIETCICGIESRVVQEFWAKIKKNYCHDDEKCKTGPGESAAKPINGKPQRDVSPREVMDWIDRCEKGMVGKVNPLQLKEIFWGFITLDDWEHVKKMSNTSEQVTELFNMIRRYAEIYDVFHLCQLGKILDAENAAGYPPEHYFKLWTLSDEFQRLLDLKITLDTLHAENCLTDKDMTCIMAAPCDTKKTKQLFDILLTSDKEKFEQFVNILRKTNQTQLYHHLRDTSHNKKRSHLDILTKKKQAILSNLDVKGVVQVLEDSPSKTAMKIILDKSKGNDHQARELTYEFLLRSNDDVYRQFLSALGHSRQRRLVYLLEGPGYLHLKLTTDAGKGLKPEKNRNNDKEPNRTILQVKEPVLDAIEEQIKRYKREGKDEEGDEFEFLPKWENMGVEVRGTHRGCLILGIVVGLAVIGAVVGAGVGIFRLARRWRRSRQPDGSTRGGIGPRNQTTATQREPAASTRVELVNERSHPPKNATESTSAHQATLTLMNSQERREGNPSNLASSTGNQNHPRLGDRESHSGVTQLRTAANPTRCHGSSAESSNVPAWHNTEEQQPLESYFNEALNISEERCHASSTSPSSVLTRTDPYQGHNQLTCTQTSSMPGSGSAEAVALSVSSSASRAAAATQDQLDIIPDVTLSPAHEQEDVLAEMRITDGIAYVGYAGYLVAHEQQAVENMTPDPVIEHLWADSVLTDEQRTRILSGRTQHDRSRSLLQVVRDEDHMVFTEFIRALDRYGQEHVANLFRPRRRETPGLMSEEHRAILRRQHVTLLDNMETYELVGYMRQGGSFTAYDSQRVLAGETPYARNRTFMHILHTKNDAAFGVFQHSLQRTNQGTLASLLRERQASAAPDY